MPRCKHCKEKFEPLRFNQKFCLKSECIQKADDEHWKKVRKPKIKKDLVTIQDYIKIAQQVFNTYIRLRDKQLGNPCFSCRKPLKDKFDAGHYYNANNHWNLRFDERNVFAQCVECNQHKHGNLIEYRKQLEFYYGISYLNELDRDSRITRKFTIDELKQIIETYKQKIKQT